jgi:hypothetical protein
VGGEPIYPPSPSNTSGCTKTHTFAAKSEGVVYRSRRFPVPRTQTQIVRIRIKQISVYVISSDGLWSRSGLCQFSFRIG